MIFVHVPGINSPGTGGISLERIIASDAKASPPVNENGEQQMPNLSHAQRESITNRVIEAIEAGCPPWRRPWTGRTNGACLPLRHNGEPYRGINVLLLWSTADRKGYSSARWFTFKQAQALGGRVRKGEKSAAVMKCGTMIKEDENGDEKIIRFARYYSVFNADQIDGLPETHYHQVEQARDLGTQADPEMDAFFASTGASIVTVDEPRAYYDIGMDRIHIPPIATFHDSAGYYATLAHELTHWTGSESRLDRFNRLCAKEDYAFEELVAEIGNCFLCADLGLTPDFQQTGAYLERWLQVLKKDSQAIFRASSEAQKAVDYIHEIQLRDPFSAAA